MGSMLSRRGDVLVSQTQRARVLSSAVIVASELGYGEMSVARITANAGVSRRTFYDLFEDREDCFLAAFEETVSRARDLMLAAYGQERGWAAQTRKALIALLAFLDEQPGAARLLVVDSLKAGARVQRQRAEILRELSGVLHQTGSRARGARELPTLTSEGVVGAVLTVIHTRLSENSKATLVGLAGELMGVIVLPYLGAAAACREVERPAPSFPRRKAGAHAGGGAGEVLTGVPMRITYRTLLVLAVIAEHPGASNRQIADEAGVSDQGQISKLLARLEGLDLIHNDGPGYTSGEPNRWRLTAHGERVQSATTTQPIPRRLNGAGSGSLR
jgi:AcrR family transcriptional regulator